MTSQSAQPRPEPGLPPAGWYQDPQGPGTRWWDGRHWTDDRQGTVQAAQPVPARALAPGKPGFILTRRVLIAYVLVDVSAVLVSAISLWGWLSNLHLATGDTQYAKPGVALIIFPLLVVASLVPMGLRSGRAAANWREAGASRPVVVQRATGRALRQLDRRERVQFGYRGGYWAGLVIAALLWAAGLGLLFLALSDVSGFTTYSAWAYILGGLMLVGLAATVATWPTRTQAATIRAPGPVGV